MDGGQPEQCPICQRDVEDCACSPCRICGEVACRHQIEAEIVRIRMQNVWLRAAIRAVEGGRPGSETAPGGPPTKV